MVHTGTFSPVAGGSKGCMQCGNNTVSGYGATACSSDCVYRSVHDPVSSVLEVWGPGTCMLIALCKKNQSARRFQAFFPFSGWALLLHEYLMLRPSSSESRRQRGIQLEEDDCARRGRASAYRRPGRRVFRSHPAPGRQSSESKTCGILAFDRCMYLAHI